MNRSADEFLAEYQRATNGHNLEATLSMIDEDAVYFFSDETVHVGREAIERALRTNFETIEDETYMIRNIEWLAQTDEVAVCVYDFAWSGTVGGTPASGSGRGSTALKREGEDWRVVHEHLSRGRFVV